MEPIDPMTVLCRAADLTAEGAQFLESNDFDEAYNFFTRAYDIVVQAEATFLAPKQTKSLMLELRDIDEILKGLPQDRPVDSNIILRNYNNSAFFVYDEPLLFVPETQLNWSFLAFYKAVLLFDIALVLHKKSNCVDAWSVYRALHFYELSLEYCNDCPNHPSCLEISAAALNNKAHIYFEHCEYPTARTVLDALLVTMIFTHGRPLEFEEKNTQGVLFNLYMLRMPTSAQTA